MIRQTTCSTVRRLIAWVVCLTALPESSLFGGHHLFVNPSGGTAGTTCNGGNDTITEKTTFAGTVLKHFHSTVKYSIDLASIPGNLTATDVTTAIDSAFSAWRSASGSVLNFVPVPWTTTPCSNDGVIRLFWLDNRSVLEAPVDAKAFLSYSRATGEIVGAAIAFNLGRWYTFEREWRTDGASSKNPLKESVDVQTIATHEIGHALGLGHSNQITNLVTGELINIQSASAVMQRNTPNIFRTLTTDDVSTINSLYPPVAPITALGSAVVSAKSNGNPWTGSLSYSLNCPFRLVNGFTVPATISSLPVGQCVLTYVSGGPPNASLTSISPCVGPINPSSPACILPMSAGGQVSFLLNFSTSTPSVPPMGAFVISSGGNTVPNGQTLSLTVALGGRATVTFDASPSVASGGPTLTSWLWKLDGALLSTSKVFSSSFSAGTYSISLIVTDTRGVSSPPVEGTVQVGLSQNGYTGSMNLPRQAHTATLLDNGLVLVTGGVIGSAAGLPTFTSSAELYNPQTGMWRFTGLGTPSSMSIPRGNHTATKLSDGRVLIVGGTTRVQPNSGVGGATAIVTSTAEIFDPLTESFQMTGQMTSPRVTHDAVLTTDGRVLVVGGAEYAPFNFGTAEIYDVNTAQWSFSTSNLTDQRIEVAITRLANGNVLVPGGSQTSLVSLFDQITNSWRSMTPLLYPRWTNTANTLPNGKVLIAGGNYNGSPIGFAELYDAAANGGNGGSSMVPGAITVGGWNNAAASLPNGDVLLAGGHNFPSGCSASTANVQLFRFSSGTLISKTPMIVPRTDFTATRLQSGQVLIVGGINVQCGDGTILSSAELTTP